MSVLVIEDEPKAAAFIRRGLEENGFVVWLTARSGRQKAAPKTLGSARHPVVVAATGTYVYAT